MRPTSPTIRLNKAMHVENLAHLAYDRLSILPLSPAKRADLEEKLMSPVNLLPMPADMEFTKSTKSEVPVSYFGHAELPPSTSTLNYILQILGVPFTKISSTDSFGNVDVELNDASELAKLERLVDPPTVTVRYLEHIYSDANARYHYAPNPTVGPYMDGQLLAFLTDPRSPLSPHLRNLSVYLEVPKARASQAAASDPTAQQRHLLYRFTTKEGQPVECQFRSNQLPDNIPETSAYAMKGAEECCPVFAGGGWEAEAKPKERFEKIVRDADVAAYQLDIRDEMTGAMKHEMQALLPDALLGERAEVVESLPGVSVDFIQALQLITRNEAQNVTGSINYAQYHGLDPSVIRTLKDLTVFTVNTGITRTKQYGGYPDSTRNPIVQQDAFVILLDSPGLQFQTADNTGRLFLYSEDPSFEHDHGGLLDDLLFRLATQEERKSLSEVQEDYATAPWGGRYFRFDGSEYKKDPKFQGKALPPDMPGSESVSGSMYFDKVAYIKFIAYRVLLLGRAACAKYLEYPVLGIRSFPLAFQFLQEGTGFFADILRNEETGDAFTGLRMVIKECIGYGILQGLEQLFEGHLKFEDKQPNSPARIIKLVSLPYFTNPVSDPSIGAQIMALCHENGISCCFGERDALKNTFTFTDATGVSYEKPYLVATNNCADPDAVAGNERKYGSVDAAMADNFWVFAQDFMLLFNGRMQPCRSLALSANAFFMSMMETMLLASHGALLQQLSLGGASAAASSSGAAAAASSLFAGPGPRMIVPSPQQLWGAQVPAPYNAEQPPEPVAQQYEPVDLQSIPFVTRRR